MWIKKLNGTDKDYTYYCGCGTEMDETMYNPKTGTYTCLICGSESPDLENIEVASRW